MKYVNETGEDKVFRVSKKPVEFKTVYKGETVDLNDKDHAERIGLTPIETEEGSISEVKVETKKRKTPPSKKKTQKLGYANAE